MADGLKKEKPSSGPGSKAIGNADEMRLSLSGYP